MDESTDNLSLVLPRSAENIRVARMFLVAVGRHHGLDEEAVDDLKIAVSEAFAGAVEAGGRHPMTIEAGRSDGRLLITMEGVGELGEGTAESGIDRLALIRSLFPDAELDRGAGRLVLPLPSHPTP